MIKEGVLIIGLLLFFTHHGKAQSLVVSSRGEHLITFINLKSGEDIVKIQTGESPHEMVMSKDKKLLFVASYFENLISKIDVEKRELLTHLGIEKHRGFHGIVISEDMQTIWVTAEEDRAILELDASSGKVINVWPTNSYKSHMVAISPNEEKLYVANIDNGNVSVINRKEGRVKIIETGSGAEGIDVSPNGKEVWVSNRAENTISIIDTSSDEVIQQVNSGGSFPVKLKFRPDAKEVWVSNNRSGTVAVFDTESRKIIKTIRVGGRPLGITFSTDNKTAYISNPGTNEVFEITTSGFSIKKRFKVSSSPDALVYIDG